MASHDDVAQRWANRILTPGRGALSSRNLHDSGDSIFSYGSHFEVGRILRDRKGNPTAWLLNGNTYSNTTSKHQAAVRGAVARTGLPTVTIPHAALGVAGIDLRTIEIVDVQRDWWTTTTVTKEEMPGRWEYDYACPIDGDRGGWQNTKTGEIVLRKDYSTPRPTIECDCVIDLPGPWAQGPWDGYCWERKWALSELREVHIRARHGAWEEFGAHRRRTGRKRVVSGQNGRTDWDLVDDPTAPLGYVFQRDVQRHWLGASLIKAQVPYQVQVKHAACGGTGVADEPWFIRAHVGRDQFVSGPLTEEQMRAAQEHNDRLMERNGGIRQPFGWLWELEAVVKHTECRGCGGRGRVPATRRRTAYFLSGFDENETRPSYFFCELPPKVHPTTVAEALETLKPTAVKLAEQAGREVRRQGDIFCIPMPGVTLRELKKQGGVHIKRPKLVEQDGRLTWDGPRPNLLGTNHEATEVVRLGDQTWARGTISHVPEGRRPDHKRTPLGREWHLIQKNTVPVSA